MARAPRGSKREVLIAVASRRRGAQFGGAPDALDAEGQDEQGLIQMAIVELGRCSEHGGNDGISRFEFFQDGVLGWHKEQAQG
jgi:hypothetical protein